MTTGLVCVAWQNRRPERPGFIGVKIRRCWDRKNSDFRTADDSPAIAHAPGAQRRNDLVRAKFVARVHSGEAPFFSSAGQLTITSSGCDPPAGFSTRNRLPSGATV